MNEENYIPSPSDGVYSISKTRPIHSHGPYDKIPHCPHCGRDTMVYRKIRAWGWARDVFDPEVGDLIETDINDVMFNDTKTLRCLDCHKIRNDVEVKYHDGIVIGIRPKY